MKFVKKSIFNLIKIDTRDVLVALLALIAFVIFIPVFTYAYFAGDLESKDGIMNRNNTGIILTDREDRPFYEFYQAKNKTFIPLSEIPEITQQAIIAAEDKRFYQHSGFSITAILGALVADVKEGGLAYGGSTITQQLVKNSLLNSNKKFLRKYQEIVLAAEIERRYSKAEILEMYLNSVYFGEGAFGIENAAKTYFGKSVRELNLAESSLIASLLPAPSQLSPVSGDADQSKLRQKYVLKEMKELGYISEEEKSQAENLELVFNTDKSDINSKATHFALLVMDRLIEQYGEEQIARSGFKVKTTLNLDYQEFAEKTVADQVEKLKANNVSNGSTVVVDPKRGEVLALVGSRDWFNEEFGRVNITTSLRSPGSSFKPIVFAAALQDRVITPATVLKDSPTKFVTDQYSPVYEPKNYDRKFRGQVLTRRALANSLNVPAVEIMQKVGVPRTLEMAKQLGINSLGDDPSRFGLSLVLGTGEIQLLELTQAYSVFANNGVKNDLNFILQIEDKVGNPIYAYQPEPEQVLEPEVAFQISSILSDNSARSEVFGNALTISRPAAVKTGTAEDYKDALTVGYTPSLVVGVWVGNNDGSPMDQVAGSLGAAPIWKQLMERFLASKPRETFEPPEGIVAYQICKSNGLLASKTPVKLVKNVRAATSSASIEYFVKGTEPNKFCNASAPKPAGSPDPNATPPQGQPTPQPEQTQQPQEQPPSDPNKNVQIQIQGDGRGTSVSVNGQGVQGEKKEKEKD